MRRAWLKKIFLATAVAACLGAQTSALVAEPQNNTPQMLPAWRDYAQFVLYRMRGWLAGDDGVQRLRDARQLPPDVIASVWVTPQGAIDRIATHSLDAKAAAAIRHAAEGRDIGVPPADMPQPLRLRFTFKREGTP